LAALSNHDLYDVAGREQAPFHMGYRRRKSNPLVYLDCCISLMGLAAYEFRHVFYLCKKSFEMECLPMTDIKSILALALAERLRSIADSAPPFAREHGEPVGIVVNLPGAIEREAATTIIQLCERLERAESALKPFAEQAEMHGAQMPNEMFIDDYEQPDSQRWISHAKLTIGNLRAARAALQEKP
jgi:hypothetical protein